MQYLSYIKTGMHGSYTITDVNKYEHLSSLNDYITAFKRKGEKQGFVVSQTVIADYQVGFSQEIADTYNSLGLFAVMSLRHKESGVLRQLILMPRQYGDWFTGGENDEFHPERRTYWAMKPMNDASGFIVACGSSNDELNEKLDKLPDNHWFRDLTIGYTSI